MTDVLYNICTRCNGAWCNLQALPVELSMVSVWTKMEVFGERVVGVSISSGLASHLAVSWNNGSGCGVNMSLHW